MPTLLEMTGVRRVFHPRGEPEVEVLGGIDLAVQDGESVAIVGPSGSGKSTLLNLMGGLDRPTSGCVRLAGDDLARLGDADLARLRNRQIGFVFQLHHLLPQCTAMENVLVPTLAAPDRGARPRQHARARELLERVGLGHRLDAFPATLSGGERQRVAVARSLVNRPRLLLADEPTGALDVESARELTALLVELNRSEAVALVVVTHSRELAAAMDRRLRLESGLLSPADEAQP
ncbi:MAG: ABC transporter ATP-binding protein [Lentisphaeria bacterium]|nr:ABC transporter ATP-binding protein [Lentisphaeria bacterium]